MGNYISCNCGCTSIKASSPGRAFASESRRKLIPKAIMMVHPAEGRVIELGDGEPMKVAELMLEYPGYFVAECEMDPAAHHSTPTTTTMTMKRATPLPADDEASPGRIYVLFPMHRLHSRVAPHELATFVNLLSSHILSTHQLIGPPCSRKMKSLHSLMQGSSAATAKVTPLSSSPTIPEFDQAIPAHLCASHRPSDVSGEDDDEIDALLERFCASGQGSSAAIGGVPGFGKSGSLVRSRSWIPKLETINESSVLVV